MKKNLFLLTVVTFAFTSCGGDKKGGSSQQTASVDAEVVEIPAPDPNAVHELEPYDFIDSVRVGSHTYAYHVVRSFDETCEVVTVDGVRWQDTKVSVTVSCDGNTYFQHTFTRQDFRSALGEMMQQSILLGCARMDGDDDFQYFNVCVGAPDSDMDMNFRVRVGRDGSYAYEEADIFNEDEISRFDEEEGV